MRRMLIPLAGLVLLNAAGCLVMGKCDCQWQSNRPVTAIYDDGGTTVVHSTPAPPPLPTAPPPKELPKTTPDK